MNGRIHRRWHTPADSANRAHTQYFLRRGAHPLYVSALRSDATDIVGVPLAEAGNDATVVVDQIPRTRIEDGDVVLQPSGNSIFKRSF